MNKLIPMFVDKMGNLVSFGIGWFGLMSVWFGLISVWFGLVSVWFGLVSVWFGLDRFGLVSELGCLSVWFLYWVYIEDGHFVSFMHGVLWLFALS